MINYPKIFYNSQRELIFMLLEELATLGPEFAKNNNVHLLLSTKGWSDPLPAQLLEKYPEKIYIALVHQFSDLVVNRETDTISVTLSFGGRPVPFRIPFECLLEYHDSVGMRTFSEQGEENQPIRIILREADPVTPEEVVKVVDPEPPIETDGNIIRPTFGR